MWQHVQLSEQTCPRDTLACCWDVKRPTKSLCKRPLGRKQHMAKGSLWKHQRTMIRRRAGLGRRRLWSSTLAKTATSSGISRRLKMMRIQTFTDDLFSKKGNGCGKQTANIIVEQNAETGVPVVPTERRGKARKVQSADFIRHEEPLIGVFFVVKELATDKNEALKSLLSSKNNKMRALCAEMQAYLLCRRIALSTGKWKQECPTFIQSDSYHELSRPILQVILFRLSTMHSRPRV